MRMSESPGSVAFGVVCAGLLSLFAWYVVSTLLAGMLVDGLLALCCCPFFLVGAIGGVCGAHRLPDKSIAELVEMPVGNLFRR